MLPRDFPQPAGATTFNRPFPAKIKVDVWDFGPLGTATMPLQRSGFPQRKCILKDIYTEIIFIKYKDEIQVITTETNFLRCHTNPSNQHYANYHEIRSHMRRFIIRIHTDVVPSLIALYSVEWMISLKLFIVVANVGNPSLCSGFIAIPSGPKSAILWHSL